MDSEIQSLFIASVDEVLKDLLGIKVRQTIYNCLEEKGIRREEMPSHLDHLDSFLDQNLGEAGKIVQKHIARRLYVKLGWQMVDVPAFNLSDYVEQASQRIRRHVNWQTPENHYAELDDLLPDPIP
jgi:hypothetical protein